jgi:phospholipid transport system substrate-binding protein
MTQSALCFPRLNTLSLPGLALLAMLFGSPASAAPAQPPDQMVQQTANQVLDRIRQNRDALARNPGQMYQLANELVLPHFDFDFMSQLVLGRYWRDATPQQRQRFSEAFKKMMVRSYGNALLAYRDEQIQWDAAPRLAPGATEASVRSSVIRKNGPPVPINYMLHLKNNDWLVYDITVDAISIVTNYRGAFTAEIKKSGIDGLIARLEQKSS